MLSRLFSQDTRKNIYPGLNNPRFKQFAVNEQQDTIYAIIDHWIDSIAISSFPNLRRGGIDAVYVNDIAFSNELSLLAVGGKDYSGSPPLKVFNTKNSKFLWIVSNLSERFVRKSKAIKEQTSSRYNCPVILQDISSFEKVSISSKFSCIIAVGGSWSSVELIKYSLDGRVLKKTEIEGYSGFVVNSAGTCAVILSGNKISILNTENLAIDKSKEYETSELYLCKFIGDNDDIIVASKEGEILFTDVNLEVHWTAFIYSIPRCIIIDNWNKLIYIGTNLGDLFIFSLEGKELEHIRVTESIRDVALFNKGRSVLLGCKNMDLHLFKNESVIPIDEKVQKWEESLEKLESTIYTSSSSLTNARVFISYASLDKEFVEKLERSLIEKGLEVWRDDHKLTVGSISKQISKAILKNELIIVVLSKNSLTSDWVKWELDSAREQEKNRNRDIIVPIAIDDYWKVWNDDPILKREVLKYHILSFSDWELEMNYVEKVQRFFQGIRENYLEVN